MKFLICSLTQKFEEKNRIGIPSLAPRSEVALKIVQPITAYYPTFDYKIILHFENEDIYEKQSLIYQDLAE